MTDDEIKQLKKLQEDRDLLGRVYSNAHNMDRVYDDSPTTKKKWYDNFINPDAKSRFDKVKRTLKVNGHMENFRLSVYDFDNEMVRERVRQIQSEVCKIVEKETSKLYDEINDALKNYSGQTVTKYFKERLKIEYEETE